jgi:hypothetical protein
MYIEGESDPFGPESDPRSSSKGKEDGFIPLAGTAS